jgi:hypothetical protein
MSDKEVDTVVRLLTKLQEQIIKELDEGKSSSQKG